MPALCCTSSAIAAKISAKRPNRSSVCVLYPFTMCAKVNLSFILPHFQSIAELVQHASCSMPSSHHDIFRGMSKRLQTSESVKWSIE